jgi:hypothetical protein
MYTNGNTKICLWNGNKEKVIMLKENMYVTNFPLNGP